MFLINKIYSDIIKQFDYLVSDFDYMIIEKSYFGRTVYVKYQSSYCVIIVYVEGRYVGLVIEPLINVHGVTNKEDERFELFHILNYTNPELHFKENIKNNLHTEIKRISSIFLTYCKKIIKGNFDIWPELDKKWNIAPLE